MSADDQPRTSAIFIEDSNEECITILTRDDACLFVPKTFLPYCSPVFKKMMTAANTPTPFRMEGTLQELELVFTFLHPSMPNPALESAADWRSVYRLAERYEMDALIKLIRPYLIVGQGPSSRPICDQEPLPALILAHHANFAREKEVALRMVARSHFTKALKAASDYELPVSLTIDIQQRREVLEQRLTQGLSMLCELFVLADKKKNTAEIVGWVISTRGALGGEPTVAQLKACIVKSGLILDLVARDEQIQRLIKAMEQEEAYQFRHGVP